MGAIELYHGSKDIIEKPFLGGGNRNNDYGYGFYCTTDIGLAKEWSCTERGAGYANKYLLDIEGLSVMYLNSKEYHILNWLAILLANRTFDFTPGLVEQAGGYILDTFLPEYVKYDMVVGYRADDSYFAFSRAFLAGTISLQQLRRAMKLGKLGEQHVLKSVRAFEKIKFIGADKTDHDIFYPKRRKRDSDAREDFRRISNESSPSSDTYILDILRQQWRNDDARLR